MWRQPLRPQEGRRMGLGLVRFGVGYLYDILFDIIYEIIYYIIFYIILYTVYVILYIYLIILYIIICNKYNVGTCDFLFRGFWS